MQNIGPLLEVTICTVVIVLSSLLLNTKPVFPNAIAAGTSGIKAMPVSALCAESPILLPSIMSLRHAAVASLTKHNPPIPPTPEGQDCSHNARCVNCSKKHASDNCTCKYWQKRFDGGWIFYRYKAQKVSDSFTKFFSSSNVLPAGQHDRRIPQRLP